MTSTEELRVSKICIHCHKDLPLDRYYRKADSPDKLCYFCKDCASASRKIWYQKNKLKVSQYSEEYNKNRRVKDEAYNLKKIANTRKMMAKYPEKNKARYTLRNAVMLGKVSKYPCEVCGDPKSQGHHEDYSKPLDVKWLCTKCHGREGRNEEAT